MTSVCVLSDLSTGSTVEVEQDGYPRGFKHGAACSLDGVVIKSSADGKAEKKTRSLTR